MVYNEFLSDRIRKTFKQKRVSFEEKMMMGGLCFLVDDKMCIGVSEDKMMARIGPEASDAALKKKGCREMDFTGRPMKGFVYVEPEGLDLDEDLRYWVDLCVDFNSLAKSSKKKKR